MDNLQTTLTTKMLAENNRARVLQLIYNEKQVTRRAICDSLNLSAHTVGKIVEKLVEEGLIEDGVTLQSSGGRKPKTLSFIPTSRCAAGVEIMTEKIRLVMVDLWGAINTARTYPLPFECTDAYLDKVAAHIQRFIEKYALDPSKLLGIGISVCGSVRNKSMVLEYSSLLGVREWDMSRLADLLDYPVMLINDAYAAGYMEFKMNTRMNRMYYIALSEGVDGALMIDNEIFTGYNNRAGSIGHMVIPGLVDGAQPTIRRGFLDEFCSTRVLTGPFNETLESFFLELHKGEAAHQRVWDVFLENLALGISTVRSIVDIAIVLGGTLGPYMDEYLDTLFQLCERFNPIHEKSSYILAAYCGGNASAVGAALQFVNRFLDF